MILIGNRPLWTGLVAWIGGIVVGAIPLLTRILVYVSTVPAVGGDWHGWGTDILFIVISTSGTAILTVVSTVTARAARPPEFGALCYVLALLNVIFIIFSAVELGLVETPLAVTTSLNLDFGLLAGAILVSGSFEVLFREIDGLQASRS